MKKLVINKKIWGVVVMLFLSVQSFATENTEVAKNIFDNSLNFGLAILALAQLLAFLVLFYTTKKVITTREIWRKKGSVIGAIVAFLLISNTSYAASGSQNSLQADTNTWILVFANIVLFVLILWLKGLLNEMLEMATGKKRKSTSLTQSLTNVVPIENEADIMTDHEYDGIRELDNNLPPWWVGMFYLSIVFAIVYIPYYHFSSAGMLQEEEYITEMQTAEEEIKAYIALKGNMIDETSAEQLTDATSIANGKELFISKTCGSCHGQVGEGGIGPNLTDAYWLHGGDVKDIFKTIKLGVPATAMRAWKKDISPAQIQDIASYILSIQGSNPANPKAPEGDLYTAKVETSLTDSLDAK